MIPEFKNIQAIFFDIDGTLSDTDDKLIDDLYHKVLFLRKIWKKERILLFLRNLVSFSMRFFNNFYHFMDRLGMDDFFANLSKLLRTKEIEDTTEFLLIPYADKILELLEKKYILGVVSSRNEPGVRKFLKDYRFEKYFNVVVSAHTCKFTKPFPQPLLFAAQQVNIDPEYCLMVGDTVVDVAAGKAAGMKTIALLCGFGMEDELRTAEPDRIAAGLFELEKLLL